MIRWCAYCQKFLGEVPPIESKAFSHGICKSCLAAGIATAEGSNNRMKYLVDLNAKFWDASFVEDHAAVVKLADEGFREGIRPIDILFGFAGPMLFKVGEMWEKNTLTHFEEARFTRSVETLIELVDRRIHPDRTVEPTDNSNRIILANVFGNEHTLGLKFAQIGLASLGISAAILFPTLEPFNLVAKAVAENYSIVGLSISLESQQESLAQTLAAFHAEAAFAGKIIVGGAGLNQRMIDANMRSGIRFLTSPSFDESERTYWHTDS